MRSPERPVDRPSRMAVVVAAASLRAWAWRRLVTRMVSSSVAPRIWSAIVVSVVRRSSSPCPVFVENDMVTVNGVVAVKGGVSENEVAAVGESSIGGMGVTTGVTVSAAAGRVGVGVLLLSLIHI